MDLSSFGPLVGSLIQAGSPMISTALQMGIGEIPIVGGIVGPLVGMAAPQIVRMIATQLGAPADATPAQIAAKIQDDPQGAKAALASLESQHQFALAQQKQADDYAVASQAQQVAIGTAEVENPRWYVAGWRPAIGWGLGALVLASFALPYLVWGSLGSTSRRLPRLIQRPSRSCRRCSASRWWPARSTRRREPPRPGSAGHRRSQS